MSRRSFLLAAVSLPVIEMAWLSPLVQAAQTPQTDAHSVRRWDKPLGATVADEPSEHYRFERLQFDSADGMRHYRVYLGIPRKDPPVSGYPALYMLDGNAAMATLSQEDLARLYASGNSPVLVGIGYDVASRHDVVARAYDYTPPVLNAHGETLEDVIERGRKGGGADRFLDLVEQQIRPAVEGKAMLDPARQTLWGHSYGGLFTLYALVSRPALFQRYVAGDPTVDWAGGALLKHAERFHAQQAPHVQARVLVGGARRTANRQARAAEMLDAPKGPVSWAPPGRESTYALVERLSKEGMDITFTAYPAQNHGQLFATSLQPALALASKA